MKPPSSTPPRPSAWRARRPCLLALLAAGLTAAASLATLAANPSPLGRLSVGPNGVQASARAVNPASNFDGTVVAWESYASELVPNDDNGLRDVFVRDNNGSRTVCASLNPSGHVGHGDSGWASVSGDGRYVAFESWADDLVPGDLNGALDIFVRDLQTGTTVRVNVSSTGVPATDSSESHNARLSFDGRYVVFYSSARNLVPDDNNGGTDYGWDVFLRDRDVDGNGIFDETKAGRTKTSRVSVSAANEEGKGSSFDPAISGNGRYVVFSSRANNLVANDTRHVDVFLRDVAKNTTERVSVYGTTKEEANGDSGEWVGPWFETNSVSDDGNVVCFSSRATNLATGRPEDDVNGGGMDIFVRDRRLSKTEQINVQSDPSAGGIRGNGEGYNATMSANGRFVVWEDWSNNLVDNDINGTGDVLLRDRETGTTTRLSASADWMEQAYGFSENPAISGDGQFVAFFSEAPNLMGPGADTNEIGDIFERDLHAGLTPSAPSNLIVTLPENSPLTEIDLKWDDNSGNESGFEVWEDGGSGFSLLAITAPGSGAYAHTGLTQGSLHRYKVRAVNGLGASDFSNMEGISTKPVAPASPTDLRAGVVSSTQIDLAWTDNSDNEYAFALQRKNPDGSWPLVPSAVRGINETSYKDRGRIPGTAYTYRVLAANPGGLSPWCNEVTAVTPFYPVRDLVGAATDSTHVSLTWTANGNTAHTGYRIYRWDGGVWVKIAETPKTPLKYVDDVSSIAPNGDGLFPYRITAFNATTEGDLNNGNQVDVYTMAPTTTLVARTVSHTRIDLTWQDASYYDNQYEISRKDSARPLDKPKLFVVSWWQMYGGWSDTGLSPGVTYAYRIRGINESGGGVSYSSYSNTATATTFPLKPPTPSGLTARAIHSGQVLVTWTDNSTTTSKADGFILERKLGTTGQYQRIAKKSRSEPSYDDFGVVANRTYSYRVRAFNLGGHSPFTGAASVVVLKGPTRLTAAVSLGSVALQWQDNSQGEDGFIITRRKDATGEDETLAVGANVKSYTDTTAVVGTSYTYFVKAYKGSNSVSSPSNALTLTAK
jgi:hypothetical protein